jgi:tRNA-splicing ligase RtcB (3'-phosphate/5'-hydroxy nucleic acid ligase)
MITNEDLREWGYEPGPIYGSIMKYVKELNCETSFELRAAIGDKFGTPPPRLKLRPEPLSYDVAMTVSNDAERENLEMAKTRMDEVMRSPVAIGGALMPDACPTGSSFGSMPVGGVVVTDNQIIPAAHSADICCSMYATFFKSDATVSVLMDAIQASTRFGPGYRESMSAYTDGFHNQFYVNKFSNNQFLRGLHSKALYQIQDQGDGNHFAYLGEVTVTEELANHWESTNRLNVGESYKVLVTHHGSRSLGAMVYKRGLSEAKKHVSRVGINIPDNLAWLEFDSYIGREYWDALQMCREFTYVNHRAIHQAFHQSVGAQPAWSYFNPHNFVWYEEGKVYHGKGATPLFHNHSLGLIPLNMSEPILLVASTRAGHHSFAPHGAGRNHSRSFIHNQYDSVEEANSAIDDATKGLDIRWYSGVPDVSESPTAYKNAEQVKQDIDKFKLGKVIQEITPLGCIMAGEFPKPWLNKN